MVQTLQPIALSLIVLWPTLSSIVVILRLWSRWLMRKFYWDDILIIIAWLSALGECVCVYNFSLLSWQGYHYYDIPKIPIEQQVRAWQFDIANQAFYIPILGLVKASVIIFLWRLEDPRTGIRVSLASLFVFNLSLTLATWLTDILQCSPVRYYWEAPRMDTVVNGKVVKAGGTCVDKISFYLVQSGLAVLTDILILLIPAAMILSLRMEFRKKIAVWAILSLGWIVTIVGITRVVLYYYRFQPDNIDRSYSVVYTLSGMEVNLAIMTACGPALKALFTRYVPRMFPSRSASVPRGNVTYWPRGFEAPNHRGRSGFSNRWRSSHTRSGDRPRDVQYGMDILNSIEAEESSQGTQSTVHHERVVPKKADLAYGLANEKGGREGKVERKERVSRPEMAARSAGRPP